MTVEVGNQGADLEKLRLKGLLKEFATYRESKGRLKQFRTEAVRAGVANAWSQKDYKTIVEMAERLPGERAARRPRAPNVLR